MSVITILKPLRDKLGDDATEALAKVIKEVDVSARQDAIAIAEERLERRLAEEIGKLKAEMIKWMFIFWASQLGFIFAFLKFLK